MINKLEILSNGGPVNRGSTVLYVIGIIVHGFQHFWWMREKDSYNDYQSSIVEKHLSYVYMYWLRVFCSRIRYPDTFLSVQHRFRSFSIYF